MSSQDGGYLTDTLVILIFVHLSGTVIGMIGSALWFRRLIKDKGIRRDADDAEEEDAEEDEVPLPPPAPSPSSTSQSTIPPQCIVVGTTKDCYAYHRMSSRDFGDKRCNSLKDLQSRHPGEQIKKRFYSCKNCFPEANDLPRGTRPRRVRDNVPLAVD